MNVRPKGACDPCCNDWKMRIKELWEKYQGVVTSIKASNKTYYPDGAGQVALPGMLTDLELVDMGTYWNAVIETDISSISLTDNGTYWELMVE